MLNLFQSSILLTCIFIIIYILSFIFTKYLNISESKNNISKKTYIKNYMGFILIIFGLLKLYDLPKFVNVFSKYDLISKEFRFYAFLYPFIEIILGFLMIKHIEIKKTSLVTITLMSISIISVILSINNGENLRCGCLGTFFHIPLSYVTISENIIMFLMVSQIFNKKI